MNLDKVVMDHLQLQGDEKILEVDALTENFFPFASEWP